MLFFLGIIFIYHDQFQLAPSFFSCVAGEYAIRLIARAYSAIYKAKLGEVESRNDAWGACEF